MLNRRIDMRKYLLFAFLGALACYSCSNSYDLLENDLELANAASDYELSTEVIGGEADTAKIETVADEQTIQASKDVYEQELMNRQSTAKEKVMRTAYAATTNVVGVFKVGSCGTYKELTLYLDAEDTRQNSKISGNVGDTYVDGNGNVRFKFCLTEANRYYAGGVFLVDHINYSQYGNIMTVMVRYHDCDDDNADNKIIESNHSDYQHIRNLKGYTVVDNNAALAWAFPTYPKPQWTPSLPTEPKNYIEFGLLSGGPRARSGSIYVDDEDSKNRNWLKRYKGYNFEMDMTTKFHSQHGMDADQNTTYYVMLNTDRESTIHNPYDPNFGSPIPKP